MATDSPAKPKGFQSDSDGYTRLHIAPLDSDLLSVVIPAAVLPQARNISYHTLEAFPERRYGFVELPTADAEKVKKRLHGATLKGSKMRIEQARPEAIPQPRGADEEEDEKAKLKRIRKEKKAKDRADKSNKRKREGGEIVDGVELQDRKIKRGWTVTEADKIKEKRKEKSDKSKDKADKKKDKNKKREIKSKHTNAPECLFKQKMPKSPEPPAPKDEDEEGDDGHKRKKRKGARQVLVHEFEKTTKYPTFLKASGETSTSEPLTFEEGKGWVDAEGNVKEAVKISRPSFAQSTATKKRESRMPAPAPAPVLDDDDTSSSGSSSDSDSDSDEEDNASEPQTSKQAKTQPKPVQQDEEETSSSGSSESESNDEEETPSVTPAKQKALAKKLQLDTETPKSPISALKSADSARPKSSGSATSLTIKIPPATPATGKVHPLEALYKRPQGDADASGDAAPDAQPFSFFGGAGDDDDIDEEDDGMAPPASQQHPMTPYTRQDFDFRNVRSAAPTPDTAHPSRSYNLWPRSGSAEAADEDEEEDEEHGEEDTAMTDISGAKTTEKDDAKGSEFQKWFWEHRGDLNRSWKKRRKTASKEKRNRENRARAARAI
ncbi:uncharacterized protein JN550_004036 [Neoarthrinium moseri]|uniref:uncharacterized protein n=1 Tax=Neoarthrinium moseri TaxID=1658444 RepID=UPI001FDB2F3D|nr:uncharacterized protein JN550_004036 [Neoarthrinium moseri]KAI1872317.1 hypothetical protein JN550_004036 [Neoarthrinium moseri]